MSIPIKEIIFITENINKHRELQNYITENKFPIKLTLYKPHSDIYEIQSLDRKEIIINKMKEAYNEFSRNGNSNHINHDLFSNETWLMVEDTSLCIEKQNGFPGPFIKFYLQVMSLTTISNENWASKATSIVTLGICKLCPSNEIIPYVFEGSIDGLIVSPIGDNGFGYDKIFRPNGTMFTNAQMSTSEKEKYNPRTKAFEKVIKYIV